MADVVFSGGDKEAIYEAFNAAEYQPGDHPVVPVKIAAFMNKVRSSLTRGEGMSDPVFVFGSNLAGRHGRGAAYWAAHNRGAVLGKGVGHHGNSYAIPTKDATIKTLPLHDISLHVRDFLTYARLNPELQFQVTPIGCGLAGYDPSQIAPMFTGAPANCILPSEFLAVLEAKS